MTTLSKFIRPIVIGLTLAVGTVTVAGPLTGCAAFGVVKPESFNEKVIAAEKTIEGAAELTLALFNGDRLSESDAKNVLAQLVTLKEGVNVARQLRKAGDFSNAETRLAATIQALTILQGYLRARDGGAS